VTGTGTTSAYSHIDHPERNNLPLEKSLSKQTANALTWRFLDFVAVKVVFLVRLLILARLLAPEDFGLLAIGVTAITVLIKLSDFGIEPALIQRPDVKQQDYDAGWTIGVMRATLVALVILLAAPQIAAVFGDLRATAIIQVLAVGVILDALASAKIANLNRNLQFRSLAITHLAQAGAATAVAITMAPTYGVWALVAGSLVGSLAETVTSYIVAPYRPRLRWHKSAARGLLNYGRWIFLTGVIVMIANAGMRAIISRYLGVAELGIFFLAGRLAFLPYMATVEVVGSVAFPVYARLRNKTAKARELFRATLLGTATLLIPSCLLLAALAPGLVEHVLGDRWSGTTTVIQILAISSPLGLAGFAAIPLLKGFGLPSRVTIFELLQSGLSLALVWWLVGEFGLLGAVMALLISVAVSQPLGIAYTRTLLERPYAGLWRPLLAVTAASLTGAVIAGWLNSSAPGIAGFIMAGAAGAVVTVGLILIADHLLKLDLVYALARHFPALERLLRIGGGYKAGAVVKKTDN
jgi:O-antigen/teichoic acid export membrane protein